jgi:hypothetical protein
VPDYAPTAVWVLAWVVPLFFGHAGWWAWPSVLVPLAWPATRHDLRRHVTLAVRLARNRLAPTAPL